MKTGDSPERVMRLGLFFIKGIEIRPFLLEIFSLLFHKFIQVSLEWNLCAENEIYVRRTRFVCAEQMLCAEKHALCSTY